ncbi:MAG TPA: class I tRNA ligase family protein, partial [Actinomycetota bacterium]|nr:class I tRNA ligase family protein [Actinomycetota bacterium]
MMSEAWTGEGVMVHSGPFDGRRTPEAIPEVIAWLEEEGKGRAATSYRLRDWLISRQRYWGAPIPIIHCPACGLVAVPERDLPVLLPEDVDFSPQGVSPLAKHEAFVNVTCPSCGGPARRETDTMDTFVDSSWYFLRYLSPHADRQPWPPQAAERWMPVDTYSGGIEHAILHLLYARFVTKALFDLGLVPFIEPFIRLVNQGMVYFKGGAFSKSRGNVVEPLPLIERWGADTIRLAMMFASPPEDDMDWAAVSVSGVHKWLGRVWRVVHRAAEVSGDGDGLADDELRRFTHRTVKGVTMDLERIAFNVAISKLMTLTNELQRALDSGIRGVAARDAAEQLVLLVAPMAPHIAEELWHEALGHSTLVSMERWPTWDERLAREDEVVLVVQVDGKVRDRITVPVDADEAACLEAAHSSLRVRKYLDGAGEVRAVVRPPRLVNFVTT